MSQVRRPAGTSEHEEPEAARGRDEQRREAREQADHAAAA